MPKSDTSEQIRGALQRAESIERKLAMFHLSGRGHEPRVVLDRQLAAVVRYITLERIELSGFGPKFRYPQRVFARAVSILLRARHTVAAEMLRRGLHSCSR
jgi:hypothetical protein